MATQFVINVICGILVMIGKTDISVQSEIFAIVFGQTNV